MTALLPWLLIPGLLLLVGMGLGTALLTVRQARRELERRTGLITGGSRSAFRHGTTWGMRAAPLALLVTGAVAACLALLALRSGLHLAVWALLLGGIGAFFFAPRVLLKREQSRADQKFLEAFPDTIDMAIRMLRAGVPISGAIRSVGNEAPPPVNGVFTNLADQMAIGITFEDALATAGHRIGLPDFQFFAIAVALQRATGGNLASTLDILSDIMRKRRAMRLKARAVTGEVRMSAYVLGARREATPGACAAISIRLPNWPEIASTRLRGCCNDRESRGDEDS